MISKVPASNPAPPIHRVQPERAPIFRIPRQVDLSGAPPDRPQPKVTLIGHMGTRPRIDIMA